MIPTTAPGARTADVGRARKVRLDTELVHQGFFTTQAEAMRAVLAGEVSGASFRYSAPGTQVREGTELHVRGRRPYVSRGGLKLAAALDAFGIDPEGLTCVDVGCSTGGFTDVLLRRGAASVLAVDVGYAQFDWGLRHDARVELLERTNVVDLMVPERRATVDLAVSDVSFTSVATVLPAITWLLKPEGSLVTLVKPQFEAAPEDVQAGGIVRDGAVRKRVVEAVMAQLEAAGYGVRGLAISPITGAKGNHEYLLWATRGAASVPVDTSICLER